MNMKRLLSVVFAAAVLNIPAAQASDNETISFRQGKLIIPHLRQQRLLRDSESHARREPLPVQSGERHRIQDHAPAWQSLGCKSQVVGDWKLAEVPGAMLGIFARMMITASPRPPEEDTPLYRDRYLDA